MWAEIAVLPSIGLLKVIIGNRGIFIANVIYFLLHQIFSLLFLASKIRNMAYSISLHYDWMLAVPRWAPLRRSLHYPQFLIFRLLTQRKCASYIFSPTNSKDKVIFTIIHYIDYCKSNRLHSSNKCYKFTFL